MEAIKVRWLTAPSLHDKLGLRPCRKPGEKLTLIHQLGSTTVGITTPHGTILAVEKRVPSPLLESSSIEKIMEVDKHIGCAMSGLTADARTMVDHARVTSQMHDFTYDEPIGVESCTQAVCDLALRFGESVEDDDALMVRRPYRPQWGLG